MEGIELEGQAVEPGLVAPAAERAQSGAFEAAETQVGGGRVVGVGTPGSWCLIRRLSGMARSSCGPGMTVTATAVS